MKIDIKHYCQPWVVPGISSYLQYLRVFEKHVKKYVLKFLVGAWDFLKWCIFAQSIFVCLYQYKYRETLHTHGRC